ncbi:MAG: SurA N-terminal domain-containing protein [Clostridia bacterium]|nr:SurA N-terminal domain-containing protein [Clostridia bacterium]
MKIFLLTAAIFCISLLQAQGKQVLGAQTQRDSILASVNGESITLQDVMLETNADEAKLASLYNGEDLVRKIEEIRRKVLENLINRKLIYATYKKEPFDIPSQHVEDMLGRRRIKIQIDSAGA